MGLSRTPTFVPHFAGLRPRPEAARRCDGASARRLVGLGRWRAHETRPWGLWLLVVGLALGARARDAVRTADRIRLSGRRAPARGATRRRLADGDDIRPHRRRGDAHSFVFAPALPIASALAAQPSRGLALHTAQSKSSAEQLGCTISVSVSAPIADISLCEQALRLGRRRAPGGEAGRVLTIAVVASTRRAATGATTLS